MNLNRYDSKVCSSSTCKNLFKFQAKTNCQKFCTYSINRCVMDNCHINTHKKIPALQINKNIHNTFNVQKSLF